MRFICFFFILNCVFCSAQDTISNAGQGTIRIVKPKILPYVIVKYHFNIINEKVKKGRSDASITPVQFYDTTGRYSVLLPRVRLSEFLVKKINYNYSLSDTPRIDSLRTVLIITKDGKLKKVLSAEGDEVADKILEDQFVKLMSSCAGWDKDYKVFQPGGLVRRKNFFRNEKFTPRDFNVEATVLFASYPQTADQNKTGRRYDIGE